MRRSKFNAKKISYNGMTFDSRKELERWQTLRLLERAGRITELRRQVKYPLQSAYTNGEGKRIREITYIADFVYRPINEIGTPCEVVVEDTKGYKTDMYRLKNKMFERVYYPLVIVES